VRALTDVKLVCVFWPALTGDEAHKVGNRDITDMVMSQTSDRRPWCQASRSDPCGHYGDFYVESDTSGRYSGAGVIRFSSWVWAGGHGPPAHTHDTVKMPARAERSSARAGGE